MFSVKSSNPMHVLEQRLNRIDRSLLRLDLYMNGMFAFEAARFGFVSPEQLALVVAHIMDGLQASIQKEDEEVWANQNPIQAA